MMMDKDSSAAASVAFSSYCDIFGASFKEEIITFTDVNILYEMIS